MGQESRLFGPALVSATRTWLTELGKSDRDRLDTLVKMAVTDRIRVSDCLAKLFPELNTQKSLAAFTSLRMRLNGVAKGDGVSQHDLGLRFEIDSQKQSPPSERTCWFTGPDPAEINAAEFSAQAASGVAPEEFVRPRGITTNLRDGKRLVRVFISYSHQNKLIAISLIEALKTHFKSSKSYIMEFWIDQDLMVGDDWDSTIQKAIANSDFGLFLVSSDLLASSYTINKELPRFVNQQDHRVIKAVIPIGLVPIDFSKQDLKGLQKRQFFFPPHRKNVNRFYSQLTANDKTAYALALFCAMEKRLDSWFEPPGDGSSADGGNRPPTAPTIPPTVPEPKGDIEVNFDECVPHPDHNPNHVRTFGRAVRLDELESLGGTPAAGAEQGRDALAELEAWAVDPKSPPFYAILGEYGIGKTTTLKQFTLHLLEKRKTDRSLPLPIYVDLRAYSLTDKNHVPTISQLLASVIERDWKVVNRAITPDEILRLVREDGALIIFDGLDEKIVHLTPDRAREFIRTLWAVIPEANAFMNARYSRSSAGNPTEQNMAEPAVSTRRLGKMLISCRSHYFPDVWSQNAMLVGQDRDGISRKEYPALCLLPFNEQQILSYLTMFLGNEAEGQKALDMIKSIHNLRDLAERPYLLSLISSRLGELDSLRAQGEVVNAAQLYDLVVRSWLSRDDGKHQINPTHKRTMMEDLAAALWRDEVKQWTAAQLEQWLDRYLSENMILRDAYANKDRDVLKEDLRTATFVLRPDSEKEHFRFAHTSLQEYFLAAYLVRALNEKRTGAWDIPMISIETLDFVGQILTLKSARPSLPVLNDILRGKDLRAVLLAFRYWLRAIEMGWPEPAPQHVNLQGANLDEWVIRGHSPDRLLNLRGANLNRAQMNRTRWENVDLAGADLRRVEARQSLLMEVYGPEINATEADFSGLQWRRGSLAGANVQSTRMACELDFVSLVGTRLTADTLGLLRYAPALSAPPTHPPVAPGDAFPEVFLGHRSSVNACAWSPNGQFLLSASSDNSLKIWDASSAQCLHTLQGHSRSVLACAWSLNGQFLLSASLDNSLKIWDASSAQCLHTLHGHSSSVLACAWSPDGKIVFSGSADGTIKKWNAATGECLWTGYELPEFQTAAISGDGKQILSASPEAWRWLGWRWTDPSDNQVRILPAEYFGPLPGKEG
ncbi:MAG TPA: TIR domain-containing protein [Candidatus Limnocylindria bacterium]|nr:TIR domain-containing protein [Candidatus Limnocylindria bacterium]